MSKENQEDKNEPAGKSQGKKKSARSSGNRRHSEDKMDRFHWGEVDDRAASSPEDLIVPVNPPRKKKKKRKVAENQSTDTRFVIQHDSEHPRPPADLSLPSYGRMFFDDDPIPFQDDPDDGPITDSEPEKEKSNSGKDRKKKKADKTRPAAKTDSNDKAGESNGKNAAKKNAPAGKEPAAKSSSSDVKSSKDRTASPTGKQNGKQNPRSSEMSADSEDAGETVIPSGKQEGNTRSSISVRRIRGLKRRAANVLRGLGYPIDVMEQLLKKGEASNADALFLLLETLLDQLVKNPSGVSAPSADPGLTADSSNDISFDEEPLPLEPPAEETVPMESLPMVESVPEPAEKKVTSKKRKKKRQNTLPSEDQEEYVPAKISAHDSGTDRSEEAVSSEEAAAPEEAAPTGDSGRKKGNREKGNREKDYQEKEVSEQLSPDSEKEQEEKPGFGDLPLSKEMLRTLKELGYQSPTPIQAGTIGRIMAGVDLIGQAKTGTGKTAAFGIPIIEQVETCEPGNDPVALIVVPTRELAVQVRDEILKLSRELDVITVACYGGKPISDQIKKLSGGVDIVVGTPGRIIDLVNRRALSFSSLRWVVLDEADRMLDIGFRPDIEKILKQTPRERQTLLFSATLPTPVVQLAKRYMTEPEQYDYSEQNIASETIEQFYVTVDRDRKFDALLHLIQQEQPRQAIVFCRTKRAVDKIANHLQKLMDNVSAIHGDLSQDTRDRVMKNLRNGKVGILVATDVVGRGIDVSGISHIINYDIPEFCDDYVHRVGRTGRMGREGVAFTLVTSQEGPELTRIEKRINRLLQRAELAGFEAYSKPVDHGEEEKQESKPVFGQVSRRVRKAL